MPRVAPPLVLLAALACASLAAPAARAAAPEEHTLKLVLSESLTRDANLFRLPDFADSQLVLGNVSRSDQISATSVGLRFDKPYAQQRFQLDVTESAYRYKTFSYLNFEALDYRGAWLWHLTPRVSGALSADHKENLASFADFSSPRRNVITTDARNFTLDGWIAGAWHVLAAASQYERKNSIVFTQQQDYRSKSGEAGLKYLAPSGSSIALVQRSTQGDYVNRVIDPANLFDNKFRRSDTELRANWNASGRSTLNGRLTWLDYRHEHFAQRDFSGLAGRLEYAWTPTGRLQLNLSAGRDIAAWTDLTSSYTVTDTLAFAPTWRPSAKAAVYLRLSRAARDFLGPIIPLAGPLRSDTTRSAQAGVDWLPHRYVTLSASVQRESRGSSLATAQYDDTIANLSLILTFF